MSVVLSLPFSFRLYFHRLFYNSRSMFLFVLFLVFLVVVCLSPSLFISFLCLYPSRDLSMCRLFVWLCERSHMTLLSTFSESICLYLFTFSPFCLTAVFLDVLSQYLCGFVFLSFCAPSLCPFMLTFFSHRDHHLSGLHYFSDAIGERGKTKRRVWMYV